jgi:hypothetical protein
VEESGQREEVCHRVRTLKSPTFNCFYGPHPVTLTCDCGATSSLVRLSFAIKAGFPISHTSHSASQADGKTKLEPCGETHITLHRGRKKFELEAVIVKDLDCDVIVGIPFLKYNGIVVDFPNDTIVIDDQHVIQYTCPKEANPSIRRVESFLLLAKTKDVILPGEFLEL